MGLLSLVVAPVVGFIAGIIVGLIWGNISNRLNKSKLSFLAYILLVISWLTITIYGVMYIADTVNQYVSNPSDILIMIIGYGALYSFGALFGTVFGIFSTQDGF